ncbi:MAG: leucine-rich repeat domain-containing protein [Clostridiales bacterium]|nr:leucine-rich repeat domain-containing protein [Clostridiales bacterium]
MAYEFNKKTDKNGVDFIEITGYDGEIRALEIPGEMENIPVKSVADNAFSHRADIVRVRLPQSLTSLGRYAFYGCMNLKTVSLFDGISDYGDGVIKQCGSLSEIHLTQKKYDYTVMRDMLSDNDRQLRFFLEPSGMRLTFPAYVYTFEEDVEARVLHHRIEGSGYPYRECVTRTGIDLMGYDGLFKHAVDDDRNAAAEIAIDRLMTPVELSDGARGKYKKYLQENADGLLEKLIPAGRKDEVECLCAEGILSGDAIMRGLVLAAGHGQDEIAAVLVEYRRREAKNAGNVGAQPLTLEDW